MKKIILIAISAIILVNCKGKDDGDSPAVQQTVAISAMALDNNLCGTKPTGEAIWDMSVAHSISITVTGTGAGTFPTTTVKTTVGTNVYNTVFQSAGTQSVNIPANVFQNDGSVKTVTSAIGTASRNISFYTSSIALEYPL